MNQLPWEATRVDTLSEAKGGTREEETGFPERRSTKAQETELGVDMGTGNVDSRVLSEQNEPGAGAATRTAVARCCARGE